MAVYTSLDTKDIEILLSNFDIGTLEKFTGISGGITNSNFFIDTSKKLRYILTIFEEHQAGELSFYFNFMAHLSFKGFSCPNPIHDQKNQIIHILKNKPAAFLSKIPGIVVEDPNESQLASMAENLAKMHMFSLDFKENKPNGRNLGWMKATFHTFSQYLDSSTREFILKQFDYLSTDLPSLPSGIIHADLFRDNVLFNGNEVGGFIDFYYACNDYFIYDLAIVINDWCIEFDGGINEQRKKILLDAYNKTRQLNSNELNSLDFFLILAAMRFLISRYHDSFLQKEAEMSNPKDPLFFLEIIKHRSGLKF